MKKLTGIILFFGIITNIFAQNATVEKSVTSIQTGVLGIWVNNESRLTNHIALRTEAGLGTVAEDIIYILTPTLSVEPRYYYNLESRLAMNKTTEHNCGNFWALNVRYFPDWKVFGALEKSTIMDQINIIPKWGIRRPLGQHFNYEAGLGLGVKHIFRKKYGYSEDKNDAAIDIHLRVGYTF